MSANYDEIEVMLNLAVQTAPDQQTKAMAQMTQMHFALIKRMEKLEARLLKLEDKNEDDWIHAKGDDI